MPPKKRFNQIPDSDAPSASGGASGNIEIVSARKKSKITDNVCRRGRNPRNIGCCVSPSDSFPTAFSDDVGLPLPASRTQSGGLFSNIHTNQPTQSSYDVQGVTNAYEDIGDCRCVCSFCGAMFWYDERLKTSSSSLRFNRCCEGGRVDLPREEEPPAIFVQLLSNKNYVDNIRAYNQMFSMASYGAHIDDAINARRGPYVFKISGQVYHWVGSLCPEEGDPPRFLQLYIYDTVNEVRNRMRFFGGDTSEVVRIEIVRQLIEVLDAKNELVKLFRTARDRIELNNVPDLRVRLYSVVGTRQYELPTSDAIGAIVFYSGDNPRTDYDIVIEYKGGTPTRVNKLHPSYMSLQFPLLFVYGQSGYHPELKLRNVHGGGGRRKDKMTMNMFYSYQLHDRYNMFGLLSKCGRLFQQYVVTAYCSIELDRLDYVRNHQQNIRNDYLAGLYDAIGRGDHYGADVGSRTILPASFTGGPRYMYSHYLDALAICRVHGNPKFFITFTCNAKWPEIRRYLRNFPGLTSTDRGDIVARIFNMKVKQFMSVLKDEEIFGPYRAVLYTIEFQKRGLPHCHTLLWIKPSLRSFQPLEIDRFISAELPDPIRDPDGFKVVSDMMMHGPCGLLNRKAPCMEESESSRESICSKKFPKPFNQQTYFDKDGFVHYKRRNLGISADKKICRLDNGYVVPYNRTLCLRFHAHINVEWCGWTMLIKYLFKYISKGTDRVAAHVPKPIGCSTSTDAEPNPNVDEIRNFVDARFICAPEACWRIFNFPIHSREPAVQTLAVHLKDMQLVKFRSTQRLRSVVNNPVAKKTTLTEWLFYNRHSHDGRHLTYLDFPLEFVWLDDQKRWKRRCNLNKPSIGRLTYMHPAFGEVFYLRMLLCHQKGSVSFEDLMTVDGSLHSTYREACLAMGLLGDDKEWYTAMEEAAATATSAQLRSLFSHILLFCDIADPLKLWKQCWKLMSDDIPIRVAASLHMSKIHVNSEELEGYVLYELQILLNQHSKSVSDYGLPRIPQHLLDDLQNRLIMEEKNYDRETLLTEKCIYESKLNDKQLMVYHLVISSNISRKQELIFVYGHGGTGKTFLWKAITTALRADGKIVLAVASSGIASLLLPSGRTAHSRFKIPIDLTDESMCNIKKQTNMASLLKKTELIIWDEVPMNDRKCLETLDRTLRDIYDTPEIPFGGLTFILGGDFRQTLPVKKRCGKREILDASIANSYLWKKFRIITLEENMRLYQPNLSTAQKEDIANFADWLLQIGDGNIGAPDESDPHNVSWVDVPDRFCIPNGEDSLSQLISFIYDEDLLRSPDAIKLQQQAIVCPKNETADTINNMILSRIEGVQRTYTSCDTATPYSNDGGQAELLYPTEYLNSQNFPGLPPHDLCLKVGVPIILLRNLNVAGGLCNGTRMIVTQLLSTLIEGEIITGTRVGQKVHIPRITLIHKDNVLPYVFKRIQHPVKLSYAMTINKSQGQSLNKIGIYLPKPVFGHGQLYVALSRATSPNGLKILIKNDDGQSYNVTKNIVYKDFLQTVIRQQVINKPLIIMSKLIVHILLFGCILILTASKSYMMNQQAELVPISTLRPGQKMKIIEAKVYRLWAAKRAKEIRPHGYSCILLDTEGNAIQANIIWRNKNSILRILQLNRAYRISNFVCTSAQKIDQAISNPTFISLGLETRFESIPDIGFPLHFFEFTPYTYLQLHTVTDYIGCIQHVGEVQRSRGKKGEIILRRSMNIIDLSEMTIEFTLWNDMATTFDIEAYNAMPKPVMIAIGSCWVKDNTVTTEVQLSGISATHYYFNPDINEYHQQIEQYREKFANQPLLQPERVQFTDPEEEKNADKYPLAEILAFNPTAFKGRTFKFEGVICKIVENNNWFYYGCPSCTRAMPGNPPNLQCPDHDTKGECLFCYSFKATVMDDTASTIVTFFSNLADISVNALVGIDCETMVTTMGHDNKREIPPQLKQLEGQRHIIEISIGTDRYGEPNYIFKRHFQPTIPVQITTEVQPTTTPTANSASPEKTQEEISKDLQQTVPVTPAKQQEDSKTRPGTTPSQSGTGQGDISCLNQTPIPPTPAKKQEKKSTQTHTDIKRSAPATSEEQTAKKKRD